MSGLFITFEGVEGSGKSTQIRRLAERLETLGIPVTLSREPGGTALGQELRSLLLTPHASGEAWCADSELLLFYADRAQHLARVIRPAMAEGRVVLVDRFEDSTRAYQGAQGVSDSALDRLGEVVLGRLRPHLTILLDLDPGAGLDRVRHRNAALGGGFQETRFDEAALEFHVQVRSRFLAISRRDRQRVVVVSAEGTPEVVEAQVWARVAPLLRSAGHPVEG